MDTIIIKPAKNGKCAWVMEVEGDRRTLKTTNGKFSTSIPEGKDVVDHLEDQQMMSGLYGNRMPAWYKRAAEVYREYLA